MNVADVKQDPNHSTAVLKKLEQRWEHRHELQLNHSHDAFVKAEKARRKLPVTAGNFVCSKEDVNQGWRVVFKG